MQDLPCCSLSYYSRSLRTLWFKNGILIKDEWFTRPDHFNDGEKSRCLLEFLGFYEESSKHIQVDGGEVSIRVVDLTEHVICWMRETMKCVSTWLHLDLLSTVGCMGSKEGDKGIEKLMENVHIWHVCLNVMCHHIRQCLNGHSWWFGHTHGVFHLLCWRRTSLELGTVRAETKRKNNQFARTSLRTKIKQLVRNQPRSRTQETYRGSINLIYIHTDFLKPLFKCANQRLHKSQNKENTRFSQEPSSPLFLSISR